MDFTSFDVVRAINYKTLADPLQPFNAFVSAESKNRLLLLTFIIAVSLICGAYFVGDTSIAKEYKGKLAQWGLIRADQNTIPTGCESQCRPSGTEALPEGIVVKTSDLELRPLWDSNVNNKRKYRDGDQDPNDASDHKKCKHRSSKIDKLGTT